MDKFTVSKFKKFLSIAFRHWLASIMMEPKSRSLIPDCNKLCCAIGKHFGYTDVFAVKMGLFECHSLWSETALHGVWPIT